MTAKFTKLVNANIQLLPLPDITTHFVFERDGFVALVERVKDGFGGVGSAGLLTGQGIAPLIWRGANGYFVAKHFEQPATEDQVCRLRAFQSDLIDALS